MRSDHLSKHMRIHAKQRREGLAASGMASSDITVSLHYILGPSYFFVSKPVFSLIYLFSCLKDQELATSTQSGSDDEDDEDGSDGEESGSSGDEDMKIIINPEPDQSDGGVGESLESPQLAS